MTRPLDRSTPISPQSGNEPPRLIAFYLPQFYPTPYNNDWWGEGFTEWSNVVKARPRFRGHYQPHLPADLGFYDLRLPESREAQADLARAHGVYGFCYYHYWFTGTRRLERPLDEVLALKKPDFPFCICWANENWTRAWDGKSKNVLTEQLYSDEDDVAHILQLLPTLEDSRYIRVEGKPLVLIYRVGLLPDPAKTADRWRAETRRAGIGDIFLASVESNFAQSNLQRAGQSPSQYGFDASVAFEPSSRHARFSVAARLRNKLRHFASKDVVLPYADLYESWKADVSTTYRRFDCVTPMWDNSARRARGAFILSGSTPERYERWLGDAVERAQPDGEGHKWIFINAWNEWGEGCHLEPCQKWGRAYLNATRRVVHSF